MVCAMGIRRIECGERGFLAAATVQNVRRALSKASTGGLNTNVKISCIYSDLGDHPGTPQSPLTGCPNTSPCGEFAFKPDHAEPSPARDAEMGPSSKLFERQALCVSSGAYWTIRNIAFRTRAAPAGAFWTLRRIVEASLPVAEAPSRDLLSARYG